MDTSKYDESERFKQGLQVRREVLGDEYVKPAIERGDKDEFQRALQQFATEDCWGSVWCRPGLDRKTRSIINLTMLSTVGRRSEEHTSELQSLMRISYAVFCLKNKKQIPHHNTKHV